jgi:GT2 family glycosyltransferase
MKLSIVILCWNDLNVIGDCLRSIYSGTHSTEFEVIVPDNGSTDGSIDYIRTNFPQVQLVENGRNLRFAKGNNVGIRLSQGEYILILNPDTIVHDGTLDKIVAFADEHPKAGAFSCQVVNDDGSYQQHVYPLPSIRSEWMSALCLGPLTKVSHWFNPGSYVGWKGKGERTIGWAAGCFLMVRGELLNRLGGFDEQFFYYYEDTDLCRRIWAAGYEVLYTSEFAITHLKGHSTKQRFPLGFELDKYVTRYRYFYKCGGPRAARRCRWVSLVWLISRRVGLRVIQLVGPVPARELRLQCYRLSTQWNLRVDPVRLVQIGEEPELDVPIADRVLER